MTPPAPMTVEKFLGKHCSCSVHDSRMMRKDLKSMLIASRAEGMREAAKLIESQFWKADQECDACGHIPEKDVAYFIKQKADSLEKEAT